MELPELEQQIWALLQAAMDDRQHAWRSCVLATVDEQGWPRARTVILRDVDICTHSLVCFTDSRSAKVSQLQSNPRASLVFWCPQRHWQLRVMGEVSIETYGESADDAWLSIRDTALAKDYLSLKAPGSPLFQQSPVFTQEPWLGVLRLHVVGMDWLHLRRSGHRRALLTDGLWQWVVP